MNFSTWRFHGQVDKIVGFTGMVLYGTGRAIFRNLLVLIVMVGATGLEPVTSCV